MSRSLVERSNSNRVPRGRSDVLKRLGTLSIEASRGGHGGGREGGREGWRGGASGFASAMERTSRFCFSILPLGGSLSFRLGLVAPSSAEHGRCQKATLIRWATPLFLGESRQATVSCPLAEVWEHWIAFTNEFKKPREPWGQRTEKPFFFCSPCTSSEKGSRAHSLGSQKLSRGR